jgi:hypothetical protein
MKDVHHMCAPDSITADRYPLSCLLCGDMYPSVMCRLSTTPAEACTLATL